jgi:plasmid stabilization system protein ParE
LRRAATVAACAALALTGCGGDDESEPASPATLVPADARLYVESVLRPEGSQREALESSLSELLDTDDPGALITEELNEQSAEDESEITYEGDIEPWLGERGAVFVTDFFPGGGTAEEADWEDESLAVVVDATDTEAAQEFIDKAAEEGDSATEASYDGVDYVLIEDEEDADGPPTTAGVVGDHVVFAGESLFQQVVDIDAGGSSLAGDERFEATGADAGEAAASLYADVPAIVEDADAAGELSRSDREALESVFAGVADQPVSASLNAEGAGFALEVSYGSAELPFLAAAKESSLLRDLPESAWFAAGFSDLGDAVGTLFREGEDFGIGGAELERAERGFLRNYGLPLEDFYGPLGDAAVFASGEGIFGAGGGLVVETENPAQAARVLAGLRRGAQRSGDTPQPLRGGGRGVEGFSVELPEAPSTLNFVAADDRLVVVYGEEAAAGAIEPERTLESSEEFRAASAALGEDFAVALFLDFDPVTELLELAATADPSVEEVLPYLEAIDFVVAGSTSDGDRDRQRIFLGLEEAVSGPAT